MNLLNQTKIILGTAQFGLDYGINNSIRKNSQISVNQILDKAYVNNIKLLDTAEAYGNAHEVIGNYHCQSLNKFDIITKFDFSRSDLPKNLNQRTRKNLETLKVNYIYCYMFHSYADFLNFHRKYKIQIINLKKAGLIKKLGVSVYTNKEVENILEYGGVDLIQLPFNLLDNKYQRYNILKTLKSRGIEVHIRSTFLQGLFFKEIDTYPNKLKPLSPYIKYIKRLINENNISVINLALGYSLSQRLVNNVIIGVDSVNQLIENLKESRIIVPKHILEKIDNIVVRETELLSPLNWN